MQIVEWNEAGVSDALAEVLQLSDEEHEALDARMVRGYAEIQAIDLETSHVIKASSEEIVIRTKGDAGRRRAVLENLREDLADLIGEGRGMIAAGAFEAAFHVGGAIVERTLEFRLRENGVIGFEGSRETEEEVGREIVTGEDGREEEKPVISTHIWTYSTSFRSAEEGAPVYDHLVDLARWEPKVERRE